MKIQLNIGKKVYWHNSLSERYTNGTVVQIIGQPGTKEHKVKVLWASGEITISPRWRIFKHSTIF